MPECRSASDSGVQIRLRVCGRSSDALPEVGQGPVLQPGDMHLGDPQLGADLGLCQVAVKAHHELALLGVAELLGQVGVGSADLQPQFLV